MGLTALQQHSTLYWRMTRPMWGCILNMHLHVYALYMHTYMFYRCTYMYMYVYITHTGIVIV